MNWLEQEQQRFRQLTNSKVKEFSQCVHENIEWITNYVDDLLQGQKKTDMSDLLKTPSTTKRRNNNVAIAAAATATAAVENIPPTSIVATEAQKKDRFGGGQEYMKQVRQKIKMAQKPSNQPAEQVLAPRPVRTGVSTISQPSRSPKRKSENGNLDAPAANSPSKKTRTTAVADSTIPPVDSSFTRPAQDRSFLLPAEFSKDRLSQQVVDSKIREQEERLKSIFSAGQERLRKAMDNMKSQSVTSSSAAAPRETMTSLGRVSFATAVSDLSSSAMAAAVLVDDDSLAAKPSTAVPIDVKLQLSAAGTSSAASVEDKASTLAKLPTSFDDDDAKQSAAISADGVGSKTLSSSSSSLLPTRKPNPATDKPTSVSTSSTSLNTAPAVDDRIQAVQLRKQEEEQKRKELLEKREEERRRKLEQIQEAKRKEEETLRKKRQEKQERVLQNQRLLRQKEEERRKQTEMQMQAKFKQPAAVEQSTENHGGAGGGKPLPTAVLAAAPAVAKPHPPTHQQQSSSLIKKPGFVAGSNVTASATATNIRPPGMLFAGTALPKPVAAELKRPVVVSTTDKPTSSTISASTSPHAIRSTNTSSSANLSGTSSHGSTPKKSQELPLPQPSPDVIDPTRTILNKHGDDYYIPAIPSSDEEDTSDDGEDDDGEDDNNSKEKFLIPDWVKSPNLRNALHAQKSLEASRIFGEIDPLRLEDIFKGSNMKRFRSRTSSADWSRDNW